jgi:glycopeptide antibiotics resistance protein
MGLSGMFVLPLYLLALGLVLLVASVAASRLGRWLGSGPGTAALLIIGFGLVLASTLLPDPDALRGVSSSGVCDTSRVGLIPLAKLDGLNEYSLNVALFVPLGLAVGMLPRGRRAGLVAVAAVSLPFIVEGIQLAATPLGRGCQTADVFDNLLGLGIGAAIGLSVSASRLLRR